MISNIRGHYGTITATIEKLSETDWILRVISDYYRVGLDADTGVRNFVDPAGGPFIHVDTKLRELHKDLPNRSIVSISPHDDGFILKTLARRKKAHQ